MECDLGETEIRTGEPRVPGDCCLVTAARLSDRFGRVALTERPALQPKVVGHRVFGWARKGRRDRQRHLQRLRDRSRNVVLDRESICQLPVVVLAPGVVAVFGADQLRGDAYPIARALDAPFDEPLGAELAPDLADVVPARVEDERRCTCRDTQPRDPDQRVDHVIGQAVGEVPIVRRRRRGSGTAGPRPKRPARKQPDPPALIQASTSNLLAKTLRPVAAGEAMDWKTAVLRPALNRPHVAADVGGDVLPGVQSLAHSAPPVAGSVAAAVAAARCANRSCRIRSPSAVGAPVVGWPQWEGTMLKKWAVSALLLTLALAAPVAAQERQVPDFRPDRRRGGDRRRPTAVHRQRAHGPAVSEPAVHARDRPGLDPGRAPDVGTGAVGVGAGLVGVLLRRVRSLGPGRQPARRSPFLRREL